MDYMGAWLALAAPLEQLDIAMAADAVARHVPEGIADRHWAARWADLRAVLAELEMALPSGDTSTFPSNNAHRHGQVIGGTLTAPAQPI